MVKTFLKIQLWWRFLVPHSEHLLVSSATLSCMIQNILTLAMSVYYITNSAFLSFSMHALRGITAVLFQFINNQGFKSNSFWSFIVSCCSLMLLLSNIVSSEELFRYTSISGYTSLASWFFVVFSKHFFCCSSPACWLYWGLWLIYLSSFWNVFRILFSFSQFSASFSWNLWFIL